MTLNSGGEISRHVNRQAFMVGVDSDGMLAPNLEVLGQTVMSMPPAVPPATDRLRVRRATNASSVAQPVPGLVFRASRARMAEGFRPTRQKLDVPTCSVQSYTPPRSASYARGNLCNSRREFAKGRVRGFDHDVRARFGVAQEISLFTSH